VFKLWALFSLLSNGTFEFNRYGAPQVLQRALLFDPSSVHLLDFAIPKKMCAGCSIESCFIFSKKKESCFNCLIIVVLNEHRQDEEKMKPVVADMKVFGLMAFEDISI